MNFIFAIALMIVSYAITALTAKKPQNPVASNLQDFNFPQHDEGTPQAVIFGDVWCSDWMVLYYGNMHTEAIHSKSSSKK